MEVNNFIRLKTQVTLVNNNVESPICMHQILNDRGGQVGPHI